tara:strand:- start:4780 stop:4911 length:132 start_codon:yes stop_codon:yes gene_type:complete
LEAEGTARDGQVMLLKFCGEKFGGFKFVESEFGIGVDRVAYAD